MAVSIANEAAEIHAFMCNDDRFGYSWSPRWGEDGEYVTFTSSSGRTYTLKTGSYDCSSSWQTAWRLALEYTEYAGAINDMTYTGNAESVCVGSGLSRAGTRTTAARCAVTATSIPPTISLCARTAVTMACTVTTR